MKSGRIKIIPGINIQAPWSSLIVSGKKTVETRSYPIPSKHLNRELAIIETPGPRRRVSKARIIGVVVFSECFQYYSREVWISDYPRHLVAPSDQQFSYRDDRPKYGWVVSSVRGIPHPVPAPKRKGIIFASSCSVPSMS